MKILLVFLIVSFCFNKLNAQEGIIIDKTRMYWDSNKILLPVKYMKDHIMYYLDSFIINPVYQVNITSMNKIPNSEKVEYKLLYYSMINVKTKTVYKFDSFIYRPKLLKTVNVYKDSLNVNGFENLYKYYPNVDTFTGNIKITLADTIINKKLYKRFNTISTSNNNGIISHFYKRFYTRCDQKNMFFHLDRKYDEENNCHLIRYEFKDDSTPFWLVREIVNERNFLTEEEKRIFKRWIKYAKAHPLK